MITIISNKKLKKLQKRVDILENQLFLLRVKVIDSVEIRVYDKNPSLSCYNRPKIITVAEAIEAIMNKLSFSFEKSPAKEESFNIVEKEGVTSTWNP